MAPSSAACAARAPAASSYWISAMPLDFRVALPTTPRFLVAPHLGERLVTGEVPGFAGMSKKIPPSNTQRPPPLDT